MKQFSVSFMKKHHEKSLTYFVFSFAERNLTYSFLTVDFGIDSMPLFTTTLLPLKKRAVFIIPGIKICKHISFYGEQILASPSMLQNSRNINSYNYPDYFHCDLCCYKRCFRHPPSTNYQWCDQFMKN